MKRSHLTALGLISFLVISPSRLDARVETYTYASFVPVSSVYSVEAGEQSQTVFVTSEPEVCAFGCDDRTTVTVRFASVRVDSLAVRPLSIDFDQVWDRAAQVLTLKMSPRQRAVVEINGDTDKPLFLFANPIDEDKPSPDDKNVIFFQAGCVRNIRDLNLRPGQTLYLEGGAWLRGNLRLEGTRDVHVRGAGVIDGRVASGVPMRITECHDVSVGGIIMLNDFGHTTRVYGSDHLTFDNYKVVATRNPHNPKGLENDALNLISCSHASVYHCFSYAHDDTFCIKTTEDGPAEDISYYDCIAWHVMGGNSFEIGYETTSDIRDISYKKIYSLHARGNETLVRSADLGIHHASRGTIENISYEDVYLEESDEWTLAMMMFQNPYSKKDYAVNYRPGHIRGVTLKNIHVLYPIRFGSLIEGYDEDHRVEGLVIDGLYVLGRRVTSSGEALISAGHADVIWK